MSAILLDTHVWAWGLLDDDRLSAAARTSLRNATRVCVCAVSFYEIELKARNGKWPEMATHSGRLLDLLSSQGGEAIALDGPICALAGSFDWAHRDPFDRLIFATAKMRGLSLVSADPAFDAVIRRVW